MPERKTMEQSNEVGRGCTTAQEVLAGMPAGEVSPHRPTSQTLDGCRRCELWRNATHGVPGAGPGNARIIVVGEQPGDQEDLAGMPFVGPAGHVLDRALIEAGIARDDVYVTNAVKHFKWELRGKRRLHKTPAQKEIEACHYWLQGEMNDSRARVVVTLGATALKAVLEVKAVSLGKVMGEVLEHDDRKIVPTYHPSYVLRLREQEEKAQAIKAIVDALKTAEKLAAQHQRK